MIVAARAGEPLPQKRLRGVLGEIDRVLVQHEVIQRAVLPRVADDVKISRANWSQGLFSLTLSRIQL